MCSFALVNIYRYFFKIMNKHILKLQNAYNFFNKSHRIYIINSTLYYWIAEPL